VQIVVSGHSRGGLGCVLPTGIGAIIAGVDLRRERGECLASLRITEQCSSALTVPSKTFLTNLTLDPKPLYLLN